MQLHVRGEKLPRGGTDSTTRGDTPYLWKHVEAISKELREKKKFENSKHQKYLKKLISGAFVESKTGFLPKYR